VFVSTTSRFSSTAHDFFFFFQENSLSNVKK
jgi:hypothetical protein